MTFEELKKLHNILDNVAFADNNVFNVPEVEPEASLALRFAHADLMRLIEAAEGGGQPMERRARSEEAMSVMALELRCLQESALPPETKARARDVAAAVNWCRGQIDAPPNDVFLRELEEMKKGEAAA